MITDDYRFNQNNVLSEFLTDDRSCVRKYFWKNTYISLLSKSLRFFWNLLHPNWSIIRGTESLNIRKNSEIHNSLRFVDFQTYFKDSLCLEKLTNLGLKGTKWSVKMWTTNFYKNFSKNILLYMSNQLSKIRSVHTDGLFWLNL